MSGFRKAAFLVAALLPAAAAESAPIVAGSFTVPVVAEQSVELFPGTPFNPGTEAFAVTARSAGTLTVVRQAQVGSTIASEATAVLAGVFPSPLPPIPYQVLTGTPDLPASSALISDVVQDPGDPGFAAGDPSSFVSGNFREEAFFKVVLADGTTIYSDPAEAAVFTATLAGLPYPPGTVFSSPGRINLYLQTGPGFDPDRDPVIGQSFNRSLTVVPEPSAALLAGLGLGLAGLRLGLRRRARGDVG